MEWMEKTNMVKLGNAVKEDGTGKYEFYDFCLDRFKDFDGQAWDMFSNLVILIPDEMKKDVEFWTGAWQYLKDVDCNDPKFGFRSGMRIAIMQTICEDHLSLTKNK